MIDRDRVAEAIRGCFSAATCTDQALWSEANRARGQCDVASLVLLEYLGGDLMLAPVFLGDKQVEHHYWNRFSADDVVDLTGEQFVEGQRIGEPEVVPNEVIRSKYPAAKAELRRRHTLLREAVADRLGAYPAAPLEPEKEPLAIAVPDFRSDG